MKRIRKILFWFSGVVAGLIGILFLLGYLFEDQIHLMAIRELGKALNARIEVRETNVSFLRSWPDVQVELEGLSINPEGQRPQKDVIGVASARLKIDLFSFFSDEMKVNAVKLVEPEVFIERDLEGDWNFADLFQTESRTEGGDKSDAMRFGLQGVKFKNGAFRYVDQSSGLVFHADSLSLGLAGDFTADRTDFNTQLAFHLIRWQDPRMVYARDKHIAADLLVDARFGEGEAYRIREGELSLAAVALNLGGEIVRKEKGYDLNLAYNTSRNDFDAFLSLLPGGLLETGREYEYEGAFAMHGWVRGEAGEGKMPVFYSEYSVENGAFRYTDYESRLTEVQMDGSFLYEEERPSESHFKINSLAAKLRNRPVTGHFAYLNFKDPRLSVEIDGALNLEDVREFYPPFADSSQLDGDVTVNLMVEGRIADFEEERYQEVHARGDIAFDRVTVADDRLLYPVRELFGAIKVDNQHIQVDKLVGQIGHSDFLIRGTVTEYLPWFFEDGKRVRGRIELTSQVLDLNDWLVEEQGASRPAGEQERFVFRLPDMVDFEVRARVDDFRVAKFRASSITSRCRLHDRQLGIHQLNMEAFDGSMALSGALRAVRPDLLRFQVDVTTESIDVNQTFRTLDQLAAFALVEENLFGSYTGDVHLEGELNQFLDIDPGSLYSYGDVEMRNGRLVDFEPLEGLAGFVKLEDLKDIQFSDVQTNYRIEDNFFYIPGMEMTANAYALTVRGRHGFDNSLDYYVSVGLPRKAARRSSNSEIQSLIDVEPEERNRIVIPVHITGTVDKPKYALDGGKVKSTVKEGMIAEKEELREGFQKEIESEFGEQDTMRVEDLIEEEVDTTKKVISLRDKLKNPFKKLRSPRKGSK